MTPLLCNKFVWLELCAGSVHAITIILSLYVHLALFQQEKNVFLKLLLPMKLLQNSIHPQAI